MGRAHGTWAAAARFYGRPGLDWAMPLLLGEGGGGSRWRPRGTEAATATWTRTAPWPLPGPRRRRLVRRTEGDARETKRIRCFRLVSQAFQSKAFTRNFPL